MEENTNPNQEVKKDNSEENITLSAALLAPLNAIFEAQVHAARAFLNFILQMGFRHKYSKEEIELLRNDKQKNKEILEDIKKEKEAKRKIDELEKKGNLTERERNKLWNLKLEWDDLLMQRFDYFDDKGNISSVFVPNLAILPVKPLGVDNANFKFELNVKNFKEP